MASKNSIRDAFREQIPGPEATSAYVRALQEIAAELTNMASSIDEGLENITNPISVSTEESHSRISKSSRVIRAYNSACGEYSNRRNRDNLFDPSLFGEASWDILLFMYINHVKREAVTVSLVCAGSCVPQTTALRGRFRLRTK